jgi:hypothetical protein
LILKRNLRLVVSLLVVVGLAVLVTGVALGRGGAQQKAVAVPGTSTACVSSSSPAVPTVDVENASAAEVDLIRAAAQRVGATLVTAVRLAGPPDSEFTPLAGYPGDRWLYVEVRLADPQSCRVEQDWQAARLAGAVRNAAAAAALPIPFGYTIIGVFPDGSRAEPISIAIGAPIGTEPVALPDRAAEAARIHRAVAAAGLQLRLLEFAGVDGAAVLRTQAVGAADDLARDWPGLLQQIVGNRPDSAWLVEIDGADGAPIKAFANSPSTAGTNGWTRPDLRVIDREVTSGG